MKSILLIGAGRFGKHIARKFSELGHEVMVVDNDEEKINAIMPYVVNAQIGDSTNEAFMSTLGISNYDVCICAIGNDFQASLETTSLLKELGGQMVVSRATRDVHEKFLLRNGADKVVYPEKQLGEWTAITYSSEKIFDYVNLGDEHAIYEVSIPDEWDGKTILDIDLRRRFGINILAVKGNGKIETVVSADTKFVKGERVLVLAKYENIRKCFDI